MYNLGRQAVPLLPSNELPQANRHIQKSTNNVLLAHLKELAGIVGTKMCEIFITN
jgi:hypothetical protein